MKLARIPGLRWRIVTVLLLVSLLPLGLVGVGSWIAFGGLLEDKSLELHRSVVEGHARSIDLYLAERLRVLDLVARSRGIEELGDQDRLQALLDTINQSHGKTFIDLGVIDSFGKHLAYAGPYALRDQNYAGERWFLEVLAEGAFVSDVFLGFRKVPHCVIAVNRKEDQRTWILRATINSEEFEGLVQTRLLGRTGDAFILNTQGVYQTTPKSGRVLEQSSIQMPERHRGVRDSRVAIQDRTLLRATTWLNGGRWMLVVQQDEAEVRAPVRRAMFMGTLVILVAVALLVATTFLATWHLTGRIDRANRERDRLSQDLLRSAKLASLGEMATGLAHEINNPLAIISAEQTNLGDLLGDLDLGSKERKELLESVERCKRQVQRCGNITAKMLQFGRKTDGRPERVDIGPRLKEIVQLLKKQAEVQNVELLLDVDPELPALVVDPTGLQQILVNLINNSLYALDGGGRIRISARPNGHEVRLVVADNGPGIPPEDMERIFQPFFTTKPPGKGTGLGLAVCYGLVRDWGGTIDAKSSPGQGTEMTIRLPVHNSREQAR